MKTHTPQNNPYRSQAGMTLMELVVVLLILVSMAGLLLPTMSGYSGHNERIQTGTSVETLAELNKSIDNYQNRYSVYPNNFDTLHDGTGIITWLPGANGVAPTTLTTVDLAADANALNIINSLGNAGITCARQMVSWAGPPANPPFASFSATFTGSTGNTACNNTGWTIATAAGGAALDKLVRINDAAGSCINIYGNPDTCVNSLVSLGMGVPVDTINNYYIAFGVGQYTDMSGRILKEAPVYFAGSGDKFNPSINYNRFLVVFRVPLNGLTPASFIGTVTPDLRTQSQIASEYYRAVHVNN